MIGQVKNLIMDKIKKDMICNFCGLSCTVGFQRNSGLINQSVNGGFESTPGNGNGALDDCIKYIFSLCEFCLDWLFARFKIPPQCTDYLAAIDELEPWQPAKIRVQNDVWRKDKEGFEKNLAKHDYARAQSLKEKEKDNA